MVKRRTEGLHSWRREGEQEQVKLRSRDSTPHGVFCNLALLVTGWRNKRNQRRRNGLQCKMQKHIDYLMYSVINMYHVLHIVTKVYRLINELYQTRQQRDDDGCQHNGGYEMNDNKWQMKML